MQDEFQAVDPQYIKDFNDGYLIAQNNPELARKLEAAQFNSVTRTGLKDGISQHFLEKEKTRLPSWLSRENPLKEKIKEPKKGRDIERD